METIENSSLENKVLEKVEKYSQNNTNHLNIIDDLKKSQENNTGKENNFKGNEENG